MTKKLTQQEFVTRARSVHGDKYDYSKSIYVDAKTPLLIKCNACGNIFSQRPDSHLQGNGCDNCARHLPKMNIRKTIFGIAVFDVALPRESSQILRKAYFVWYDMLSRCYNKAFHLKQPSYVGCNVCDEWLYFSNFKRWFDENYVEGYHLDKDILVKGNRVYSPETCCFVPNKINTLIISQKSKRGKFPIGVYKQGNSYVAQIKKNKKKIHLGCFATAIDAFVAHKQAKEQYIKELAQEYFEQGKITEKVYKALLNYKVEITD